MKWLVVILIALQVQAGGSQEGNVLFKAPEGWKRVERSGAVIYVSPDSPADRALCSLTILPGQELDGDFRAWFDAKMEKEKTGLEIVSGGGVTSVNLKDGYPVLVS